VSLIYLSKVSALAILAVSVVACSSGGNHTKLSPNSPPLSEQAAADKIAAEKAEAERVAAEKAEADRVAAEKAEADRIAAEKAEADRIAAEKAEADRIAAEKAEAERVAAEKAEAERVAAEKAEADRIAAEKAEADRIAAEKAEADRIAAEKAEAERLQKIETNRLALLAKAKAAGLTDQQAVAYAEANKKATPEDAQSALEVIVAELLYEAKGEHSKYPEGIVSASKIWKEKACKANNRCTETIGHEVIYNQEYSVVVGDYTSLKHTQSGAESSYSETSNIIVKGIKTEADSIPKLGSATYSGKAFTRSGNLHQGAGVAKLGKMNYSVDFESRKGSGAIYLRSWIYLNEGSISGSGITSTAYTQKVFDEEKGKILDRNGEYTLDFYGKKAEEIAGKVIFDGKDTIGFGGTRGEISKK